MRLVRIATVIVLALLVVILSSACGRGSANTAPTPTPRASTQAEVVKPKPVILGITASTSGMFDDYYAILNVSLTNEGADGMVILIGSISQANETTKNELPLYLARDANETVKIVLPLKWRGGDWVPSAVAEVP